MAMPSEADNLAARVERFADRVLKLALNWPRDSRLEHTIQQLIDSSTAEFANYRAARHSRSRKEFVAKIGLVAEEADESEAWLKLLWRAGVAQTPERTAELGELVNESVELRAIFVQSYQTAKANYERDQEQKRQNSIRRRRRI